MWANKEMVELVEWLKLYNVKQQQEKEQNHSITSISMEKLDFMVWISIAYGNPWKQLYNI